MINPNKFIGYVFRRMEALKKQSFSVDSASDMSSLQKQWSNEKDKEIAERLQKLKKDRIKGELRLVVVDFILLIIENIYKPSFIYRGGENCTNLIFT